MHLSTALKAASSLLASWCICLSRVHQTFDYYDASDPAIKVVESLKLRDSIKHLRKADDYHIFSCGCLSYIPQANGKHLGGKPLIDRLLHKGLFFQTTQKQIGGPSSCRKGLSDTMQFHRSRFYSNPYLGYHVSRRGDAGVCNEIRRARLSDGDV